MLIKSALPSLHPSVLRRHLLLHLLRPTGSYFVTTLRPFIIMTGTRDTRELVYDFGAEQLLESEARARKDAHRARR
jgi:hypothetical protein